MGIVRFIETNYSQARTSWTCWRALSAQCKLETRKAKLEKLDLQCIQERRIFLSSLAKLVGLGTLVLGSGTAVTLGAKYLIKSGDPLYQALKENRTKFPLPLNYLEKLVNDAGVSSREMDEIISKNQGAEGLYTLMAYSLLCKAKRRGELSQRYNNYLDVMAPLVRSGKVKLKLTDKLTAQDIDFLYETYDKIIYIDPSKILEINNLTITESSIIHELFHAFQDHDQRTIAYSRFEAEAHLVQSDYIWHVQPKLLHDTQWVQVYPIEGGFKFKFLFPVSAVSYSSALKNGDQALEEVLTKARKKYLFVRSIQGSTNPAYYQALANQIPAGTPKENVYTALIKQVEANLKGIQINPLRDELKCVFQPVKGRGELGNCRPSMGLINLSTLTHFLLIYAWKIGDHNFMKDACNHYFIDVWREDKDSLLDNSELDSKFVLGGIR